MSDMKMNYTLPVTTLPALSCVLCPARKKADCNLMDNLSMSKEYLPTALQKVLHFCESEDCSERLEALADAR